MQGVGTTTRRRDILSNFIYPNTLTVLGLKGRDIRAALVQTANYFQISADGELAINTAYIDPKPQHYNYDMWEGIEYVLDIDRPVGERVTLLNYHGQSLEDDGDYDVVMNNYRGSGGGDYEMYQGKPVIKEIDIDMSEIVTHYMSSVVIWRPLETGTGEWCREPRGLMGIASEMSIDVG